MPRSLSQTAATAAAGVAQGATAPFTLICSPNRNSSKASNEEAT